MVVRRIAIKYCGGCDPGFDRVLYYSRIVKAAAGRVEWVSLDDSGFNTVLVICGCETACPERMVDLKFRQISIRDNCRDPGEIVQALLEEGAGEDKD